MVQSPPISGAYREYEWCTLFGASCKEIVFYLAAALFMLGSGKIRIGGANSLQIYCFKFQSAKYNDCETRANVCGDAIWWE